MLKRRTPRGGKSAPEHKPDSTTLQWSASCFADPVVFSCGSTISAPSRAWRDPTDQRKWLVKSRSRCSTNKDTIWTFAANSSTSSKRSACSTSRHRMQSSGDILWSFAAQVEPKPACHYVARLGLNCLAPSIQKGQSSSVWVQMLGSGHPSSRNQLKRPHPKQVDQKVHRGRT